MTGRVHNFQSLGTLDGPGVRFVVFLQGCHLHCGYCHNIDVRTEPGQEYTAAEIAEKALRFKEYFGTDGGITLSGGEPLLQAEFVGEVFRLCRKNGISTALDTSGSVWNPAVESLLNDCDLVLLDLKMTTEEDYQEYIGCSLSEPLAFMEHLEQRKIPYWIRHVVVGGLNDTNDNLLRLRNLLQGKRYLQKTELLPFHKMCEAKYQTCGLPFPFACFDEPSLQKISEWSRLLESDVH